MNEYCDYDAPAFYNETLHKARKSHKCCECREEIKVGDLYYNCRGVWDKKLDVYKQHLHCWHFCRYVNKREYSCVPFGCIGYELNKEDERLWNGLISGNAEVFVDGTGI